LDAYAGGKLAPASGAAGLEEGTPRPSGPGKTAEGVLRTIYFDFDKSNIRPDQRDEIDANYEYLKANPTVNILVEGHCDETGTVEYNFALGERRANSIKEYLVAVGIEPRRIATVSKGEMEPAVMGKDGASLALNRRVIFMFAD
jgi:peptidoglycan-associated lipoprotein